MKSSTLFYSVKRTGLLLCVALFAACGKNEVQSLSQYLDNMIENKQFYNDRKEAKINKLHNLRRSIKNLTPQQEYDINLQLYDEFRKYRLDSAIYYVERNLEIAQNLQDRQLIQHSNLLLAQLYSFLGRSVEAEQMLRAIDRKLLAPELLSVYYESRMRFASHYAALSGQSKYLDIMRIYRDSLLRAWDPRAVNIRINKGYMLMDGNRLDEAKTLLNTLIKEVEVDTPYYAEITHALGQLHQRQHDNEQARKYYMLSAIADIKSAIKENASFRTLATLAYESGDLSRAFRYAQAAVDDAVSSNIQFRSAQMSRLYSIINAAYQTQQEQTKETLRLYLILISLLSLFLAILSGYVYSQIRRISRVKEELSSANNRLMLLNEELNEKNMQLSDANLIKEQYIAHFFDLCSMYIDKMEEYRKSLGKLANSRQMEELYKRLKSTAMLENELEELYKNFDAIFLNLYPSFVPEFNNLLVEEERIVLKSDDLLNKELRIYALLRLGITDSIKIASFLRCSLSTVYNYRTKIRNKAAISREDFEKMVMRIGVVHQTGKTNKF